MTPAGLLHSDICGSMPTYGSPQLFAVSRVLLRLPVPRHSPCALCSLTMCSSVSSLSKLQLLPFTNQSDLFPVITFSISYRFALFSFQGTKGKSEISLASLPCSLSLAFCFRKTGKHCAHEDSGFARNSLSETAKLCLPHLHFPSC